MMEEWNALYLVFYLYVCWCFFFTFGSSDFLMAIICHSTGNRDFWVFESQINFNHKNLLKDNIVSYCSLFIKLLIDSSIYPLVVEL